MAARLITAIHLIGDAHTRDWRIWFCVIVMLVAMAVYLMTGDLRWPFHGHPQPMVPIAG